MSCDEPGRVASYDTLVDAEVVVVRPTDGTRFLGG
jgi:hypothetical protein